MSKSTTPALPQLVLLTDLRQLIDAARQRVAVAVNVELTLLYWQIGQRIHAEVLQGQRAEYGKQVVAEVARQLTAEYGKGWSERQLRYCLRAAEVIPDKKILHTLCSQLSWSHLRVLILIDDPLKRDFYIEICRLEHWSVRQLQERIQSMLYERTAISRKPEETIRKDLAVLRDEGRLSADLAFRDPYVLDFLGLADSYSERDLESATLASQCKLQVIEKLCVGMHVLEVRFPKLAIDTYRRYSLAFKPYLYSRGRVAGGGRSGFA